MWDNYELMTLVVIRLGEKVYNRDENFSNNEELWKEATTMKIMKLCAHNFKGFKDLEINLEGKSTVIFGVNGTGKSTVLSVVNYLFWNWVNRLNNSQGTAFRSFGPELVHCGASDMEISAEINMEDIVFLLKRGYIKARPGKAAVTEQNKKLYDSFVRYMLEHYLLKDVNMPIYVNYGTNRSVLDIPLRIRNKHEFSKLTSLERIAESELDYRTFFEWFRNQEDLENEMKRETGALEYEDIPLRCVRTAVTAMLGNVTDLRVKRSPLRMTVKKDGVELRVDQLSDGEKCTLALFGDLARRIALANPNRENPLEGEGIVLIDEIELHMHPSWQRRVLNVLKKVFPNIQFIVTTHSPQVLSEVDDDYNIFLFKENENNVVTVSSPRTYGKDTNAILRTVMDTDERPVEIKEEFERFYTAVDDQNYSEAEQILDNLEEKIGSDSEITACRVQLDLEKI